MWTQNHSRSVSRKHRRQAVVELSNHEIANTQTKTMAKRRDEHPAKIVGPSYEETTIALKPSVAEDNEERKRLYRTVKKQRESDGKRMIQRLNARKTLYWAHGGDTSMAERWPRPRSLLLTVLNKYFI